MKQSPARQTGSAAQKRLVVLGRNDLCPCNEGRHQIVEEPTNGLQNLDVNQVVSTAGAAGGHLLGGQISMNDNAMPGINITNEMGEFRYY